MGAMVRDYVQIPDEDIFGVRVVDTIDNLKDILQEVPAEYRATAALEYVCATEDHSPYAQAYWFRPETEAERSMREARTVFDATKRETAERAQLERLLAKYGVPRGSWVRKE